eukprot:1509276-Rhodomonas_salina.1
MYSCVTGGEPRGPRVKVTMNSGPEDHELIVHLCAPVRDSALGEDRVVRPVAHAGVHRRGPRPASVRDSGLVRPPHDDAAQHQHALHCVLGVLAGLAVCVCKARAGAAQVRLGEAVVERVLRDGVGNVPASRPVNEEALLDLTAQLDFLPLRLSPRLVSQGWGRLPFRPPTFRLVPLNLQIPLLHLPQVFVLNALHARHHRLPVPHPPTPVAGALEYSGADPVPPPLLTPGPAPNTTLGRPAGSDHDGTASTAAREEPSQPPLPLRAAPLPLRAAPLPLRAAPAPELALPQHAHVRGVQHTTRAPTDTPVAPLSRFSRP